MSAKVSVEREDLDSGGDTGLTGLLAGGKLLINLRNILLIGEN